MNLEQATNILAKRKEYVAVYPSLKTANLDGDFSIEELQAIIWILENNLEYKSL